MDEFLRRAKEMTRTATYFVSGRTEAERKVLEATNDEKWGPTNTQMQDVARLTFNYQDSESIKKVIWERLGQPDDVQRCRKTLILLEYVIRTGHESFRDDTRSMRRLLDGLTRQRRHQSGELAAAESVVRKKAQDVIDLVSDDDLYRAERDKAAKLRSNVTAVGSAASFGAPSARAADDTDSMPSRKSDYECDEPAQQPFDPFGTAQPQGGAADLLVAFGHAPQPQQQLADDLLFGFGAAPQPPPAAPVFDDLLAFGAPQPPQADVPAEFADLDNFGRPQKT
jgi:hypothetical protein